MRARAQQRDRPAVAARQHAGGQRRHQAGAQQRRLPAPGGADERGERRARLPRDQLGDEALAAEEEVRVVDVERGEALEGADEDVLAAVRTAARRLHGDDAADQLVLRRAQRRPPGGDALRRLDHRLVRPVQRRVLPQDLVMQAPQLRAGLDADLLDERRPRLAVGVQRVGLPPGAVQREHALGVEALAQRLLAHEPVELADDLPVAPGGEIALDRVLERRQPELLEPPDLRRRERFAGDVVQRRAVPERERLPRLAELHEVLEPPRVDLRGIDVQLVALAARDDLRRVAVLGERLAQLGHVELDELVRARRGLLAPQSLDKPVGGHHRPRVQRQQGQQRARLARADGDGSPFDAGFNGSQELDVHSRPSVVRPTVPQAKAQKQWLYHRCTSARPPLNRRHGGFVSTRPHRAAGQPEGPS